MIPHSISLWKSKQLEKNSNSFLPSHLSTYHSSASKFQESWSLLCLLLAKTNCWPLQVLSFHVCTESYAFYFFFHFLKDIISVISLTFSCTELILLANNHGVISLLLKLKALSWFSIPLKLLTHFSSFLLGNVLQKSTHLPFSLPNLSQMYSRYSFILAALVKLLT